MNEWPCIFWPDFSALSSIHAKSVFVQNQLMYKKKESSRRHIFGVLFFILLLLLFFGIRVTDLLSTVHYDAMVKCTLMAKKHSNLATKKSVFYTTANIYIGMREGIERLARTEAILARQFAYGKL